MQVSDSGSGTCSWSDSSEDESVTRDLERRLRLWVVLGGVGGIVGAAAALARRGGGLLAAIGGSWAGPPAAGLMAARTRGMVAGRGVWGL